MKIRTSEEGRAIIKITFSVLSPSLAFLYSPKFLKIHTREIETAGGMAGVRDPQCFPSSRLRDQGTAFKYF